jgi:hypothetical protein
MLDNQGTVWNVYPEHNETTGEHFWAGATFEFTTSYLKAQRGIVGVVDAPELEAEYNITDRGQVVFFNSIDNELSYLTIVDMRESNMTLCRSNIAVSTCSENDLEYAYFDQTQAENVLDGLNANAVRLPEGFVHRAINNANDEVETTIDIDGTTYGLKLYSNSSFVAGGQEIQKEIFITINGNYSNASLPIIANYKTKTIVVGVYNNEGNLVDVSDITTVENTDEPQEIIFSL